MKRNRLHLIQPRLHNHFALLEFKVFMFFIRSLCCAFEPRRVKHDLNISWFLIVYNADLEVQQAPTDHTVTHTHRTVVLQPAAKETLFPPHPTEPPWTICSGPSLPTALNSFFSAPLETPPWTDGIVVTKSLIPIHISLQLVGLILSSIDQNLFLQNHYFIQGLVSQLEEPKLEIW